MFLSPVSKQNYSTLAVFFLILLAGCSPEKSRIAEVPEEEFSKNIRTTEARTPAEEQAGFTLPPGFKIELFASEPDIGKPMNIAFDAKGRLWVTQSNEYPFPDTTGAGKDKITILEDTDQDGKADVITTFADSLNIPIGIMPVEEGAIAYSIPYVYHLIDNDGDDKADERKVLLKGFEYKDTHGMINNFMRGLDGWMHADHGFANTSHVVGTDGDTLTMQSGNTFRFRMDGSDVQFTTTGRVNPFGYAYDEMGYLYSVDCHTSPIYQLIRGGDYPHFGKKPTGIGFAPFMMRHEYGSTALAGLEYYTGPQFPEAYQNSFFYGDVVKCRVYRATIDMQGTTPKVKQEPDFIVSADPWFRPVDVKLGPDGALYIADFYNRIIGHYEVPLDHPGRDRQRGRIWRVTYEGDDHNEEFAAIDWSAASLDELLIGLNNESITVRMIVADQIVDRFGKEAIEPIKNLVQSAEVSPEQHIHALWILYRLDDLSDELLATAYRNKDLRVRVHALRIMFEIDELNESLLSLAKEGLEDPNPHIQRASTMIVAKYPDMEYMPALLALRESTSEDDSHFFYALRQGLRDHLRNENVMQAVGSTEWEETDARAIADVMVGVNNADAARFLLKHVQQYEEPQENFINYTRHIARYLPEQQLDNLVAVAQQKVGDDPDLQYVLFQTIQEGIAQRGGEMSAKGKKWGTQLASLFLNNRGDDTQQWKVIPDENLAYSGNTWVVEEASAQQGLEATNILTSAATGAGRQASTIYSPTFEIPVSFSFHLYGRKNRAETGQEPALSKNRVQLRLIDTHEVIAEALVENDTTAKANTWNLSAYEGKQAYLAVIDASDVWGEYVAVGNFEPNVITLPAQSPAQMTERQIFASKIVAEYSVHQLVPALQKLLQSETADVQSRVEAARALLRIDADKNLPLLTAALKDDTEPTLLREQMLITVGEVSTPKALNILDEALQEASYKTQREIALAFTNTPMGIDKLLASAETMQISPRVLFDRQVNERLQSSMSKKQMAKFEEISASVKPLDEETQELIDERLANFNPAEASIEKGEQVFVQQCAPCHQIRGEGGNIGPQLDGIGSWGAQALTEKILDPNRNISKAFINYTITMKDGNVRTGLFRREEGQLFVFANAAGQEFSVPKSEVAERKPVPYTLMPDHFGEVIPENDYYALLGYLLNQK